MFNIEYVVVVVQSFLRSDLGSGLISGPRDVECHAEWDRGSQPLRFCGNPAPSMLGDPRADRRLAGDFLRVGPLRDAPRLRLLRTENRTHRAFVASHSQSCDGSGSVIHRTLIRVD